MYLLISSILFIVFLIVCNETSNKIYIVSYAVSIKYISQKHVFFMIATMTSLKIILNYVILKCN